MALIGSSGKLSFSLHSQKENQYQRQAGQGPLLGSSPGPASWLAHTASRWDHFGSGPIVEKTAAPSAHVGSYAPLSSSSRPTRVPRPHTRMHTPSPLCVPHCIAGTPGPTTSHGNLYTSIINAVLAVITSVSHSSSSASLIVAQWPFVVCKGLPDEMLTARLHVSRAML